MNSFRKQGSYKISETLELSLQDYNIINRGLLYKASQELIIGGYGLISVIDWWLSIEIEKENNMPLLIILKLLAEVESLSENCGLLFITVWFA